MSSRKALPHKHDRDMVLTHDRGSMSRVKARQLGYTVADDGLHDSEPSSQSLTLYQSWRLAIELSPEASGRSSAANELVTSRNQDDLSVDAARAFLRGLPLEEQEHDQPMTTELTDPRAARLAEIRGSVQAFNKDRGFAPKAKAVTPAAPAVSADPTRLRRLTEIRLAALTSNDAYSPEAKNLRYALLVHDQTGAPLATTFAQLGVDTSKFVR